MSDTVSHAAGLLGCLPLSVSLLVSPLTVSYCRRRSIRLTAVLGGLVASLALLFASFAVQYHQVTRMMMIIMLVLITFTRWSSATASSSG